MKRLAVFLLFIVTSACSTTPKHDITPVGNFDVERYLGKWYEIARLDHAFERGLEQVSAYYMTHSNGGLSVINRGYDTKKQRWSEAMGKGKFVGDRDTGALKVSFFGPFYGAYTIFELDEDYQYALVTGPNKNYFWILAREPKLAKRQLSALIERAKNAGFDTDALIFVKHTNPPPE